MVSKLAWAGVKAVAAIVGLSLYAVGMFAIGVGFAGAEPASERQTGTASRAEAVYVFDDRAPTPSEILAALSAPTPVRVGGLSGWDAEAALLESIDEAFGEQLDRVLVVKPGVQTGVSAGENAGVVRRGLATPIEFDLDSARIRPEFEEHIANFAAAMHAERTLNILVVGHADATGPADYNQDLSERRAASVRAALHRRHGVAFDRIRFEGRGESDPLHADGYDPRNRRVEFFRAY